MGCGSSVTQGEEYIQRLRRDRLQRVREHGIRKPLQQTVGAERDDTVSTRSFISVISGFQLLRDHFGHESSDCDSSCAISRIASNESGSTCSEISSCTSPGRMQHSVRRRSLELSPRQRRRSREEAVQIGEVLHEDRILSAVLE